MNQLSVITAQTPDEILTAKQWSEILGFGSSREVRKIGLQVARTDLKPHWRDRINQLMIEQSVTSCRQLHTAITGGRPSWEPVKKYAEHTPGPQERGEKIRRVMQIYFYSRDEQRLMLAECNRRAMDQWFALFGETVTDRTIRTWVTRIEARGGANAPLEAYLDGRAGSKKDRGGLPPDFKRDIIAKFLDSDKGVRSAANILHEYQAMWERGQHIPGVGYREGDEPLPFTLAQIQKVAPTRASRESAGRGKFYAKTLGYTAAQPMDWSEVEPMRVVFYDDKVLDVEVLTDDGKRVFRPHIYIAYCGGTRRVLAFIVREAGHMRQLDIEGLQAAVLRDHGFGGTEAGWLSRWVKERGTISISPARQQFLTDLFPGRLDIDRTSMLGGRSTAGDWIQKASGNFFGKGVLEAFMHSLDHAAKIMPGASGNEYGKQPAHLGDTTMSLEKILNSTRQGHKSSGSLIEEGILTAAMGQAIHWMETGESLSAMEACKAQGIKPPLLFFSDFVSALGELFRAFNNRRGHKMQGFAKIRVPHVNQDKFVEVTESPNDKAARMLQTMRMQGRYIPRPHDADIMLMLHKVKRIDVTSNGCRTEDRIYWSEDSNACREAGAVMGGRKTFLALYNPIQPDALYLLKNPPSTLPGNAVELPAGFRPQLHEVLPVSLGADPTDKEALARRSARVQAFNNRVSREVAVGMAPILERRTEEREQLRDRLEPLRATIRSAQPPMAPTTLEASTLSGQVAEAESITRVDAQPGATRKVNSFIAAHLPSGSESPEEETPEVI